MPVAMKIRGMTEKYVLREAARPVLTDSVYRRQKHPFLSPPSTLQTKGGLFTLVQDTLRGEALERTGLYNRKKVASLLDEIPTMDEGARTSCTDGSGFEPRPSTGWGEQAPETFLATLRASGAS